MANQGFRRVSKSMMDVPRWMGWDQLKATTRAMKGLTRGLATVRQPELEETYDEAIERMGLDAKHLAARRRSFFWMAVVYALFGGLLITYAVYLAQRHDLSGALIAISMSMVFFAFAFKEHFWFTQMKHQRLGLTFNDWVALTLSWRK